MQTISAAHVDSNELTQLESMTNDFPQGSVLRDAVGHVSSSLRAGRDLIVAEESDMVSPAVAAKIVGVSRSHLYKVLDSGELPSVSVGRDRRIVLGDLRAYLLAQDGVRRKAAERFAHSDSVREAALDRFRATRRES